MFLCIRFQYVIAATVQQCSFTLYFTAPRAPFLSIAFPIRRPGASSLCAGVSPSPSSVIVWACNSRTQSAANAPAPSLTPLRSAAADKERPINMMERVVNLQLDDSGQTLVHCCSPSALERREDEAPSSSSCAGNEMWTEMSRYNRRDASLVHLQNKSERRLLERRVLP